MSNTKFPAKKTGFSLIELSIVLVIIGIIIAGVIGGISLMKGATMQAVMSEARAYNVAATNFYNSYSALPGDYNTAIGTSGGGTNITQGNGNGVIEFVNGNTTNTTKCAEGLVAWQHLSNSGMISESTYATPTSVEVTTLTTLHSPTNTGTQIPGTDIPKSKVKNAGWVFDTIGGSESFVIITGAVVVSSIGGNNVVTPAPLVGILSAMDSLSIDTKIDDGKANAGNVQAGIAGTCSTTATYTTATTGTPCALGFQVSKT